MKIMKRLLIFIVALFSFSANGQDSVLIGHQALNKIYETKGPLFFSTLNNKNYKLLNEEGFFSNYSNTLLKSEKDFFIRLDGTGRLYKVNEKRGDSLLVKRLDSTIFFGYNGGAYEFIYRDTIMSLGGFGYWRKNGQLRHYSYENHEWYIIPLNLEIPVTKESAYFDLTRNEVYILKLPFVDLATNKKDESHLVYKLEITKKEYKLLGELNPDLIKLFPIGVQYMSLQLPSLKSELMIFEAGKIYLFDYINNEVYQLENPAIEKTIFSSSSGDYIDLAFENNGKLFYTKSKSSTNKLDSISISINDFIKQEYPLYSTKTHISNLYFFVGCSLLVGLVIFIYRRKKLRDKNIISQQQSTISDGSEYQFKQIELDLIEKIYQVSLVGKSYSVEDVNNTLGLTKKTLEIQKKIRTETLNRINHRFKMKFETDEDLIERIRSEEDRRFYRYIIREENGKKALNS
jgi:hypothetical protein